MKVDLIERVEDDVARFHPYDSGGVGTYYDFKKHPELIPKVLDDFKGWEQYEAIQVFFDLLRWINGPTSRFETSDCAFRGPCPNSASTVPKSLQSSGRLMVFFRDLHLNVSQKYPAALRYSIRDSLRQMDSDFEWGFVRISRSWTYFSELSGPEELKHGEETVVTFWAWGDNEKETMDNLKRVLLNVCECFRRLSEPSR